MTTETPVKRPETLSVTAAITQQYRQESRGLKYDQDFMLRQKYGLVSPQLTGVENNHILQEAKRGR